MILDVTPPKMEDTYRDNPLLKQAGVQQEWTKEQVDEWVKCSQDIVYFIKTYVKIVSLDEGLINFDLWPFQEDLASTIEANRFTIIKTCRQAGKTTVTAATILWHVIFKDQYGCAILANKQDTAKEILSRVQKAYENLPFWLQQGVVSWNKTRVELENGSKLFASSTASSAIRGFSINFLYLDEFAFVQRNIQDEFFKSVYPTIISGTQTKIVITSTPNGFDLFYKIWTDSVEGRNEYVHQAVNWWSVPGRDEEWKKKTIANTSEDQFRQEFEAEFIGSSGTLLSPSCLSRLTFSNPLLERYEGSLRVYKEPIPENYYVCVVDPSRGYGIDDSAFIIVDVTKNPYELVAVYNDNEISPLILPSIIHDIVNTYNEAHVMIEINDNGQQIADILMGDLEYENVIHTATKGRAGQQMGGGFGQQMQPGVRTTKPVKRIGCANMKTMIENDKLVLKDYTTVNQLSTFVMKNASYEADVGYHDDIVMCLVLFSWGTNQTFFKELTDSDFRKRIMVQKEKMLMEQILPFGFQDDGVEEAERIDAINNMYDRDYFKFPGDTNDPFESGPW